MFVCVRVIALSTKEEKDRWVLETGRQYHLTVYIHDGVGHVIHPSQVKLLSTLTFLKTWQVAILDLML